MSKEDLIEPELEDSVVAFIDILGFKGLLKDPAHFNELFKVIKNISKQNRNHEVKDGKVFPNLTSFSDCIVLSLPLSKFEKNIGRTVNSLLGFLQQIPDSLMYGGYLLRGGLARGEIYHKNGVVFGNALIEAYELESNKADTPRILVSEHLAKEYNKIYDPEIKHQCNFLSVDENDNNYYLDYLKLLFKDHSEARYRHKNNTNINIEKYKQEIFKMIENGNIDQNKIKILNKWLAYKKHVDKAISLYEKKPESEIIES